MIDHWVVLFVVLGCAVRLGLPKLLLPLAAVLLVVVDVRGVSILGHIHGTVGAFSVTTSLFLAAVLSKVTIRTEETVLWRAAALGGLVLYPAALGLGPIDPYAWGFAGWGLPIVLLVFAAWCWTTGRGVVALILFGAVAAYDLRLMESENLWDYVLDPFVALAGAVRGWWRTKAPRPDEAPADSSSHMTSLSGT